MSREDNFKYEVEETTQFFDTLKLLTKYRVGDTYYFIGENKILKGLIGEVWCKFYDYGMTHTAQRHLTADYKIILLHSHNQYDLKPNQLYKTKEEAADSFLQANDVPAELLKVLKKKDNTRTVKNLIQNILDNVDPETDLEENYWEIAKIVEQAYKKKIGFTKPE